MKYLKYLLYFFIAISLALPFAACEEDEDDTPEPTVTTNGGNNGGQSVTLPSSISGQSANMLFSAPQSGAPYADQQEVKFTFNANGILGIDQNPSANDGDELTLNTLSESNGEYIWDDNSNDFSYRLSLKSDQSINEVNVFQLSSNSFMGQFTPINGASGAALVGNYAGTYTVTSVDKGSHSRMSVTIDSQGNIDFDTNTQLNAADFALVSDRLDCCDGIWIDLNPHPTQPYPRLNLFIDSTTNQPNKMEYMPNYPNISGRVHVFLSPTSGGSGSSNGLSVSGDFSKVGGANFSPATGVECNSCSTPKITWTENVANGPDKVFSIELFSTTARIDFSANSAFAGNGSYSNLGIVHDTTAKTFTFTNTTLNERFSQPGTITVNGTLSY